MSADAVPDQLLGWCRETLAGCRRPWGIANFDLTVSVEGIDIATPVILRMHRLEPRELWSTDTLMARISALVPTRPVSAGPIHVAAELFSWGEAAHLATS